MQSREAFTIRRMFPTLSEDMISKIQTATTSIQLRKGKNLFVSGDTPRSVYAVAKGAIKVVRENADGDSVITRIAAGGDFLGVREVFGKMPYSCAAVALRDTEVFALEAEVVRSLILREPTVALQMLEILARESANIEKRLEYNVFQTAKTRVSAVLHGLYGAFGEEGNRVFQPPLSRRDIAEMADVAPETVSRVLSDLKTAGILDSRGPVFEILDMEALAGDSVRV